MAQGQALKRINKVCCTALICAIERKGDAHRWILMKWLCGVWCVWRINRNSLIWRKTPRQTAQPVRRVKISSNGKPLWWDRYVALMWCDVLQSHVRTETVRVLQFQCPDSFVLIFVVLTGAVAVCGWCVLPRYPIPGWLRTILLSCFEWWPLNPYASDWREKFFVVVVQPFKPPQIKFTTKVCTGLDWVISRFKECGT